MTQKFQGGRRGPSRGRSSKPGSPAAQSKSSAAIRPLDPTLTPPDIATFRHWELGEEIQSAIEGMGITKPSPIQSLAIGPVLAGKDVIAKAETGTGKTLAFGAPMMAKIDPQRASVLGLVLCPTRELAEQVQKVLAALGKPRNIEVALIVGGEPLEPQVKALKRGAQVVVGTPGRILDLYKQKFLNFPWTEFAILDEADVMFEFGFIDDVKEILSYTPDERQTLLFSATFPVELLKLARENTRDPVEVATASGVKTVDNIEQSVIFLDDEDRTLALMRLIENSDPEDVFLVFCPRRTDVDKLIRRLERMPFSVKALHGGYDQAARFRVMGAFRTGEVKALIATDVASRGLDVAHVTTVVNYGSPHDITDYTHRIGRTGRAGRKGRAITLVGGIDRRKWSQIEREATWKIPEVDPPLRGERPRGLRRDEPVRNEAPARTERAPRADPPRREGRPQRADRAEGPAARSQAPRTERPSSPRESTGSWPRDEHSPARARAPRPVDSVRQIEPRPDDPIDRRDRPLRHRDDAPRWPKDDDAPARDERGSSERGQAAREQHAHGPRASEPGARERAPRGHGTGGHAAPGHAPRDRAPRESAPPRAPRAPDRGLDARARDHRARQAEPARSAPAPRDERAPRLDLAARDERAPRLDLAARDERAPRGTRAPREAFPPLDVAPDHDMRPRGPDAHGGTRRQPTQRQSEAAAPREPRSSARESGRAPARELDRRAERDPRGPSPARAPAEPRREDAPRRTRADERGPSPRHQPAERTNAPARDSAPPPAARPPAPRRRVAPPRSDSGEVRPIQSRERESRRDN